MRGLTSSIAAAVLCLVLRGFVRRDYDIAKGG